MSKPTYLTAPVQSTTMPPGIPYIVGNEAAERFSYYGMKAILTIYMTQYLLDSQGHKAPMSGVDATAYYHWFSAANYAFPVLGALLADLWWGKYRTIVWLSLLYCFGHLALAVDETRVGLFLGLGLIALGSGGIKSCVSAHVGDQFGAANKHLLERVYGWFYFSINFGSTFSTLITPRLLLWYGPSYAFGLPAILMGVATFVFWWGRNRYVHIPARGATFLKESWSPEGRRILLRLSVIFLFLAVFQSLYDQTGSVWVLQAERMDRHVFGSELTSSELQVVNPILVMIFIPLFTYVIYPFCERYFKVTALGKMSVGLFFAVAAFALSGWIEVRLQAGATVSIWWQIVAYVLITTAEIMAYFSSLEFSYTQAPPSMKSLIMSMNALSISFGNVFTALINEFISGNKSVANALEGANYHWFFTGLMLLAALLFIPVAWTYKGQTYMQDSAGLVETPKTAD